uniref:Fork-head domain-containing protein n=1 Tax=Nomascus leucogenys TaxID=61853 RepID=G1QRG0_NOMLE
MKTSPRRPLILKRRRLPLPVQNAPSETSEEEPKRSPAQQEPNQAEASKEVAEPHSCKFPAGIKIINHPTMPNTQVVAIPNNANIHSIITALTAKGKESGSSGPNKFIIISCGGAPTQPPGLQPQIQTSYDAKRTEVTLETLGPKPAARDVNLPRPSGALCEQKRETCADGEAAGCTTNNSLSNIQWLRKMSSDGLGSCSIKQEMEEKENCHLEQRQVKVEELSRPSTSWQNSVSERPPYSYMAMIQFAINSTERKRMTLKDIYTWIEDHFPYFKHIAKPGWKVLLAEEGIAPLASAGPGKEEKLLFGEGLSPLLPVQSIKEEEIQPGEEMPHLARPIKVESPPLEEWPSPAPSLKEESSHSWEDSSQSPTPRPKKSYSGLRSPTRCVSEMLVIQHRERRERSRSRRKQHLLPPCVDEPELLFSEGPSTSRWAAELPFPADSSEPASQLSYSQEEGGPFKTPIKETLPVSSTPSKSVLPRTPESWRLTPPAKVGGLDFSPVQTPQGASGPLPDPLGLMDLSTTPLKSVPPFESPQRLLSAEPLDLTSVPFGNSSPSDIEVPKPGFPEPQVSGLAANRSLTEGLVLDTMNDSLSKILLDISFPGLEEDPLGPDNINWSQFIPELQ